MYSSIVFLILALLYVYLMFNWYIAPRSCETRHFTPLYVHTCSRMTIQLDLTNVLWHIKPLDIKVVWVLTLWMNVWHKGVLLFKYQCSVSMFNRVSLTFTVYILLYCIANKIQIIIKNPHYFTLLALFLTCLGSVTFILIAH